MSPLFESFHEMNGSFPSTHWTQVAAAGANEGNALASLVSEYSPALLADLRLGALRIPKELAEEILQDFLTRKIMEKRIIQQAKIARGRFRCFLQTALRNFARNYLRDHPRSITLPEDEAECPSNSNGTGADRFNVEWALQVMDKAIKRMEDGCHADGRSDLWGIFRARILLPTLEQSQPESYRSLMQRHAFANPAAAQNALVTAKRRFAKVLKEVVASYEDTNDIDEEISDLFRALSASGARRGLGTGNPS